MRDCRQVIDGKSYSASVDVFSYGILLCEIISGLQVEELPRYALHSLLAKRALTIHCLVMHHAGTRDNALLTWV